MLSTWGVILSHVGPAREHVEALPLAVLECSISLYVYYYSSHTYLFS